MQVAKTDATILMRMDSQMEDSLSTDPFYFFQGSDLIFFEELPPESPPANFQSPPRPHEDRPLDSILLCHLRTPHSLVFVCRQTFFCSHTWLYPSPEPKVKGASVDQPLEGDKERNDIQELPTSPKPSNLQDY